MGSATEGWETECARRHGGAEPLMSPCAALPSGLPAVAPPADTGAAMPETPPRLLPGSQPRTPGETFLLFLSPPWSEFQVHEKWKLTAAWMLMGPRGPLQSTKHQRLRAQPSMRAAGDPGAQLSARIPLLQPRCYFSTCKTSLRFNGRKPVPAFLLVSWHI